MTPFLADTLPMPSAIDAFRAALRGGLDPEADPARAVVPVEHGQLLLMPAQWARYTGVTLAWGMAWEDLVIAASIWENGRQ